MKKSSFQDMTTSLSSQQKNQFFTYFEGSERVQMTMTLHDINKGNYFELFSQKKNSKFSYPVYPESSQYLTYSLGKEFQTTASISCNYFSPKVEKNSLTSKVHWTQVKSSKLLFYISSFFMISLASWKTTSICLCLLLYHRSKDMQKMFLKETFRTKSENSS